jgi:serine/threonine protein kinase
VIRQFGDYVLMEEIGHGGSARVYLARRKDASVVALKVFELGKRESEAAAVLDFFQNELTVIRTLDHPNIVKYIDAGVVSSVPYIAMELLKDNLESIVLRREFLPLDDVISIVTPVAGALDYAHKQRILHRDIKPSNILFAADGRPVLSDFGIARFAPSPRSTDAVGLRAGARPAAADQLGTSDFMAPEVMQEAPATSASDIYALGMTVYYALCGSLPTDGKTIFTRSRDRVEGKLVPLVVRNPSIPTAVNDVVLRALAWRPRERFPSASAFASALMVAAGDTSSRPTPVVSLEVASKRNWLDYWRYILVPILIALIGAVAAWLASKK